jgi:fructose-1,6-bisphosphatase/inositol monophosphatase family enzyme
MNRMAWEKEVELGRAAALEAGQIALRFRRGGIEPEIKPDDSPVTAADRECERFLSRVILDAFPGDGLLGEEGADREARSGRRWILDPIDGTKDFLRGIDTWGVLIGLEADGEMVAGFCNLPAQGEIYYAWRGGGAWRNSERIHASAVTEEGRGLLLVNDFDSIAKYPFAPRLLDFMARFWGVRSMGGCQDAMLVASGRAEAWIEPSAKPWDLAPMKIIAEEAGARFFNLDGGASIHGGNCVICAPAFEDELRQFVGAALTSR